MKCYNEKSTVRASLCTTKIMWENRGVAPIIRNIGTR